MTYDVNFSSQKKLALLGKSYLNVKIWEVFGQLPLVSYASGAPIWPLWNRCNTNFV